MDLVELPHHVIQRVFDFLEPLDVYWCRCVCKTFHQESVEWLKKCPPIDACQCVARLIETYGNPILQCDGPQNRITEEQLFMKNAEMNGETPFENEPLTRWYFKHGTNFRHLPKSGVNKALESHLTGGMDCLPSFSFVRIDFRFCRLINQISFKYPTIGLAQYVSTEFELDDEIFKTSMHALLDIPKECCLSERILPIIESHIEVIHINRFASDHKVIITDWSDPQSTKPNLKDPEYPVRAFIYLIEEPSGHHPIDIVEFVRGFDFPVMRVCVEKRSLFYVKPSQDRLLQHPSAISIAFADDGRVLGFVIHSTYEESRINEFASILVETFGSIKFVNLLMPFDHGFDSSYSQILLIRI
ncbi:uncharacterized protein LOC141849884 isoform X2 [Brevipalpus obovatus]|uniref:uncharacterized protein LOC141849884 isoform X2 n=1 Tax=Brevipalpus obovatus TaxID=246614 RepID=UPI003D9F398B